MTIEERAILNLEYEKDFLGRNLSDDMVCRAYIKGATEQKAIDEEVRLKKCDNMTDAEYNRETAFVSWYLENGRSTPTYSDAIEWARKKLLEEACKWMDYKLYLFVMNGHINHSAFEQEFRKAMEE